MHGQARRDALLGNRKKIQNNSFSQQKKPKDGFKQEIKSNIGKFKSSKGKPSVGHKDFRAFIYLYLI